MIFFVTPSQRKYLERGCTAVGDGGASPTIKVYKFCFLLPNYTNIGASCDVPDTLRRTSMLMRPYDLLCDSESKEISWVNQNILLQPWWPFYILLKLKVFWVIRNIMSHFIYFWQNLLSQLKYKEPFYIHLKMKYS